MAFGWSAASPAIDAAGRMKVIVLGSPALPLGTRVFDCRDGKTNNQQVNMRHTISVLVENKFGVLVRVAGMFSGRGFNIDSLNVAPTHDATLSRITAVLKGDTSSLDLAIKQLRKLVNVVEVVDFKEGQAVIRELMLVKVKADSQTRSEIM